ncbi:DUF3558 domain-containing protein [Nocardia paucivorans]|uniref:DUF3558 domain-containing protein n=1 Tax=Nocardia paucivorans TaxID=114259 RepID=UPI0012FA3415|nr:DUF3558 domain-containing protein [Nocardia paucivorans]
MRIATALRTTLLTAAVATLASGCGVLESGEAANQGPTTTTRDIDDIVVFNPCTQISDEVLTSVGLTPSSKSVVTDAPTGPASWRVCSWTPSVPEYAIGVFSTSHTLDEARNNENHTDVRETTVGGRPALYSRDKSDTDRSACYVSFSAQQGMFEIRASWLDDNSNKKDVCALAMQHAVALEPHLPE